MKAAEEAKPRIKAIFENAKVDYPPYAITFIGLKEEKKLEVWAKEHFYSNWKYVTTYPVLKASGVAGPKLNEGDKQVPQGIYQIELLNPKSKFHLSMRLNFPNPTDLHYAELEQRTEPGSDIYIHGKEESIGCLAMGDSVIEELYALALDMDDLEKFRVIIVPNDIRTAPPRYELKIQLPWIDEHHSMLRKAIEPYQHQTKPVIVEDPKSIPSVENSGIEK